jgi:hypothetical protein
MDSIHFFASLPLAYSSTTIDTRAYDDGGRMTLTSGIGFQPFYTPQI